MARSIRLLILLCGCTLVHCYMSRYGPCFGQSDLAKLWLHTEVVCPAKSDDLKVRLETRQAQAGCCTSNSVQFMQWRDTQTPWSTTWTYASLHGLHIHKWHDNELLNDSVSYMCDKHIDAGTRAILQKALTKSNEWRTRLSFASPTSTTQWLATLTTTHHWASIRAVTTHSPSRFIQILSAPWACTGSREHWVTRHLS